MRKQAQAVPNYDQYTGELRGSFESAHCICIALIGFGAQLQNGEAVPSTEATNSGLIRETLLEQGERDPSFETFGIGDGSGIWFG